MDDSHKIETNLTPHSPAASFLQRLATVWGLAGGAIFVFLTVMEVVSITARWLFSKPIPGDFELVEVGTSLGVFMALPYAQLMGAHVIVDIATERLPERGKAFLDSIASLLFGIFMAILSWRLYFGFQDMLSGRDSTMILDIPLWSTFPIIILSTILTVFVCAYSVSKDIKRAFQ